MNLFLLCKHVKLEPAFFLLKQKHDSKQYQKTSKNMGVHPFHPCHPEKNARFK